MNRVELNSRGHQPPIFPLPSEHDSDDVESATLPASDLHHGQAVGKAVFDKCEPPWFSSPKPSPNRGAALPLTSDPLLVEKRQVPGSEFVRK